VECDPVRSCPGAETAVAGKGCRSAGDTKITQGSAAGLADCLEGKANAASLVATASTTATGLRRRPGRRTRASGPSARRLRRALPPRSEAVRTAPARPVVRAWQHAPRRAPRFRARNHSRVWMRGPGLDFRASTFAVFRSSETGRTTPRRPRAMSQPGMDARHDLRARTPSPIPSPTVATLNAAVGPHARSRIAEYAHVNAKNVRRRAHRGGLPLDALVPLLGQMPWAIAQLRRGADRAGLGRSQCRHCDRAPTASLADECDRRARRR
jgi:hypothetical protein